MKGTDLASLSGSCSHFEMLSDFNSLDASEPFHIRPRELINIEQRDNFCLGNNRLCCVIFEIMLGKVFINITLVNFPTIMVHLFAN